MSNVTEIDRLRALRLMLRTQPHSIHGPIIASAPIETLEPYRWVVQDPETHAIVFRTTYERLRPGRQPVVLREDFADFRGVRRVPLIGNDSNKTMNDPQPL